MSKRVKPDEVILGFLLRQLEQDLGSERYLLTELNSHAYFVGRRESGSTDGAKRAAESVRERAMELLGHE